LVAAIATPAALLGFEWATVSLGDELIVGFGEGLIVAGIFMLGALLAWPANVNRITDGVFGEGTDSWKDWWLIRKHKWWFKLVNFLKNGGFSPPVYGWLDAVNGGVDSSNSPALSQIWTWISLVFDLGTDAIETLYFEKEDASKGQEGDRLQRRIWFLQWWMTGAYFFSSLLVFGVKAADDPRTVPTTGAPPGLNARDYLLSLIFPVLLIAYKVWYQGGFEGELLKSITGLDWPTTDTDKVDGTILPIETDGTGTKVFTTTKAKALPVRLFAEDVMEQWTPPGAPDNTYYPQDEDAGILWDDIPKRDRQVRNIKSHDSKNTYTLKDLLDKAKFFSGILAMAAVNYDIASDKQCAEQIFRDWNLNFRTDDEWNDLMEARADGTPGFVKAAQQWWEAVSKGVDPDPSAVVQMEIATCLKPGPAKITGSIEDRTVAPNNTRTDTAHIPLRKTKFKIVDANGKVVTFVDATGKNVKTGTTDESGQFSLTLLGLGDC
jgi:hypothetical protein